MERILSSMEIYKFRKAETREIDEIYHLIEKRIKWMDKNNINQWNKTNYLDSYPRDYFKSKIEAGQLFVMYNELSGKVVGAVVLLEEDKRWYKDGSKNYYIHNLVSDTYVPGIGTKILNLCEQMALDNSVDAIRLDCEASNIKLNAFYEGLGYCYVDDVQEGSYVGHKREKKLRN